MTTPSNSQKVIRGISSQTLVTVALGVVEILSFSIMSRLLTKEDFGYFAAISAITIIFETFSETGIGSAIVQQKDLSKRYINNAFTLSLIFGLFVALLLFSFSGVLARYVVDISMKIPLMLMSVTLVFNSLTSVNRSLMHRRLEFFRMGAISLFSLSITTIVAIALAYKGLGYYAIITKAVLQSFFNYLLTLYFCKTRFSCTLDVETFKGIFSFTSWLMASSLFRNLAHQMDRLMMPNLLSVSALGAYNRPKDFVEQISSRINGIFDTALFPVLSSLQDNKPALNAAYRKSLYVMNIFASLITTGFMFNSGLLIRVFFGEQWLNLKPVMFIISSSLLFNIDGRLSDCYLRSIALTKQQFYFRVFETVLKSLGVLVGYHYGILGVACSIVVTNFLSKAIKIIYIGYKVDVSMSQTMEIIISSWRYLLLFLPVCSIAFFLLPNSWGGDIIMTVVFLFMTVVVFLFLPDLVGQYYKEGAYKKVLSFVKKGR